MGENMVPEPIRWLYNAIRPYTPRDYAEFNGVRAKGVRWFDQTNEVPDYEIGLCKFIDLYLEPGMSVVEVGGGLGVSAVYIARAIGAEGSLTVYEGSDRNVELVEDTLAQNNSPGGVKVRNAVVGRAIHLYDEPDNADHVSPDALPECDALVLDCEGTEIQILAEYPYSPEVIVVETHDELVPGCTAAVKCLLEEKGYRVVDNIQSSEEIAVLAAKRPT